MLRRSLLVYTRLLIKQLLKYKPLQRTQVPTAGRMSPSERLLPPRLLQVSSSTVLERGGAADQDAGASVLKQPHGSSCTELTEQPRALSTSIVGGEHQKLMETSPKPWNEKKFEEKVRPYCSDAHVGTVRTIHFCFCRLIM